MKRDMGLCILIILFMGAHHGSKGLYAGTGDRMALQSPDRTIELTVTAGPEIQFSVTVDGKAVMTASGVGMSAGEGTDFGPDTEPEQVKKRTFQGLIRPVVAEKRAVIEDRYNEMTLRFKGLYSLIFRVYDNGLAYRFITNSGDSLIVRSETADFRFADMTQVLYPEEDGFFSHNERTYIPVRLDTAAAGRLASLPVLVSTQGIRLLIMESALRDYPGMWLKTGKAGTLGACFPLYALESALRSGSDRDFPVTRTADYIARTRGNREFPWRVLAIARQDADLITNQLVYQLADSTGSGDFSWIRPGKVAWDWWNANNVYQAGFRSGVNTETYQYYIDFASEYGIEYIILDEGWYKLGNLLEPVPEMDIPELMAYAREKNVGIILWVIWKTLEDQLEPALDQFVRWGAVGIKVDFMQRDDQAMVNYYWKIADEAAKRHLLVDFHGAYKPAGLRRAYPNVISREGVKGLEHNKWSLDITPAHNLTLPFIRMVPGPMDYTPGAMVNAQPGNFRVVFTRPMSMTTRAHQAAMYVVYESPLQMMADSPTHYRRESECARFIAKMPTVWDDIRVLEARVSEYLIVARRHGSQWFVGAMNNAQARAFTLNLSFLGNSAYNAEILKDGLNADRYAEDYVIETRSLVKEDSVRINLAPGGGWAAILTPKP
ncbi:glycoside hydrolase family 97 protein [bacterium]|nr:glycoside hydrolase family 97 protein [bacterium]